MAVPLSLDVCSETTDESKLNYLNGNVHTVTIILWNQNSDKQNEIDSRGITNDHCSEFKNKL